jgi:hypothetical protein
MKKILTLCMCVALFINSNAQRTTPINTTDFINDCMRGSGDLPDKQVALWLPYNFWEIIGEKMKNSPEFTERLVGEMKDYNIFCVVDYTIHGTSTIFKSEEDIRKTITLKDSTGKVFELVEEKDMSPLAAQMIQTLTPTLAQMLGQFGSGLHIFVFKADQKNGEPGFNITKKNRFTLSWDNKSFKWKLPFASALEPKHCPVDGEEMKGNWNFCPEHGTVLKN